MQEQGNLVLYGPDDSRVRFTALWWSADHDTPATRATMLADGNLVLTDPKGNVIWKSATIGQASTIRFQDDGNLVWYTKGGRPVGYTTTGNWHINPDLAPHHKSFLKKLENIVTAPVRAVEKVASKIEHEVEKIPVIGDVTRVIAEVYTAPLRIAENIASGARLDHVALGALKDQLKIAKDVAPYAQTVVSFVPGVGTGVAAAIGMGAALAEGQSITAAAKTAIRGALPGGQLAQAAFDTALKVAGGENIGKAALESARAALPPSAQSAFDIGLAVVTGEKIQTALAKGLASMAPEAMQSVLAAGQKAIDSTPGLANALKSVAPGAAAKGFQLASGLIGQAGVGEKALAAVRAQLPSDVRQGFDAALNTQAPHIAWLKNVTSAPAAAAPATSSIAAAIKAAPVPKVPLVVHEPSKKAKPAAPTPIVHEPPKKTAAAASTPIVHEPGKRAARLAKYAPYPKTGVSDVGIGFFSSDSKWRWFTVYANGRPIAQRGPIWLSDSGAQREAESFLEATLGRDYIGTVTRWDWSGQAWHQAAGNGLSAPMHTGGGHHGGGGGGHRGGGGRRRPVLSRGGRGIPGWWGPWDSPEVLTTTETCRTWGDPIALPEAMQAAAKVSLGSSGGRPTTLRGADGVLYLLAYENNSITARPCAAVGVGGWWNDAWNDWSSEVKDLWSGS
jgi:hypothetical protein